MCIQALVLAVPENVTTGPYKISFDLGMPKEVYSVTVSDPKEEESLGGDKSIKYKINIKNDTTVSAFALISLTENAPLLTPHEMEKTMRYFLSENGFTNFETSEREIDGTTGAIGAGDVSISGREMKECIASYYPFNDLAVFIVSVYPWEEGTLSLLKTIHIEKINTTI